MSHCQHRSTTGDKGGLTCQNGGEVFTADSPTMGRLRRKKPLQAKDIRYRHLQEVVSECIC